MSDTETQINVQAHLCARVCPVYMYCKVCHVLEWLISDCEPPLKILMSACSAHYYFTAYICTFLPLHMAFNSL
jgi:hypothetical protein